jgi:hypothetical protein
MITSIITVEELQEKIYEKIFSSPFIADYTECAREYICENIGEFIFSCYYHVRYNYYKGSFDFPDEAIITRAFISDLEIEWFDDDIVIDIEEMEENINLKLEEEW